MARRIAGAVAAVVIMLVVTGPAGAQETSDQQRVEDLGLTVVAGFDGRTSERAWQPVTVGFEPARPVQGTLSVGTRETATTENVAVEVAAGSRKVYRVLLPPGRVEVAFAETDAEPLTVRPADVPSGNEYLVGLLGEGADSLPPLRSDVTGQSGAWVVVDPAWLELSPQSTDSLATLVASTTQLQSLPPTARMNLDAAVAGGLDLVVAGAGDLAQLKLPWAAPETPWQIRDGAAVLASATPAGYGRVVTTPAEPGAPGAGRSGELWSTVAQPIASATAADSEFKVVAAAHQFSRLLAESGGEVPALPGLGAFVLVYVLVVGPINGIVLARLGRRELAWATVPMITLIFSVGAFLGATTSRPSAGGAATLAYWTDGVGTQFVAAGVRAPTPGDHTVELPGEGWTVRPLVDGRREASVTRGADTTVAMDLTALQLGGVAAWRPIDDAPPLTVTATATAAGLDVVVRNTSGRDLTDVVVRSALSSRSLGDLAAGEKKDVSVGTGQLQPGSAYRDPFEGLPLDNNGSVTPPLSMRAVLNTEIADGRPGMVWVSGIDEGAPAPQVSSDGESVRDRGTMVAVGEPVSNPPQQGLSAFAIGRDAAINFGGAHQISPEAIEGQGPVFLRYRLPAGADPSEMTNRLNVSRDTGGNPDITVWDRTARQWLSDDEAFALADRGRLVSPLGEVWARANGEMFPFEYAGRTIAGGGS